MEENIMLDKKRLQQLAGINELEVNVYHKLFTKASNLLCNLSIGIEFCRDDNDVTNKFDIPLGDTIDFSVDTFSFPIKSKNDLVNQILKHYLKK